jgi:predicted secreted protein
MNPVTGFLIYAVMWWMVLFMVLPFGVRTVREEGGEVTEGEATSAPAKPRIIVKMLITTLISGVLMGLIWAAAEIGWIDFRAYFTPSE